MPNTHAAEKKTRERRRGRGRSAEKKDKGEEERKEPIEEEKVVRPGRVKSELQHPRHGAAN